LIHFKLDMRRLFQFRFIFVVLAAAIFAVVGAILFFKPPAKMMSLDPAAPYAATATNPNLARRGDGWNYVVTNQEGARFYIDLQTRRNWGELVEARELVDYNDNGTNWRSMTALVHYNCLLGTSAIRAISYFQGGMGTGRLVQTSGENKPFEPPVSGSPSEALHKVACQRAE
jgi:hypothetical protein